MTYDLVIPMNSLYMRLRGLFMPPVAMFAERLNCVD